MFGFGKGKIEIVLEKYNYKPGETIRGKLFLKLNKPQKARELRVEFYGLLDTVSNTRVRVGPAYRSSYGSGTYRDRSTICVYSFKMPLDTEKEYTSGEYEFEIGIPEDLLRRSAPPQDALGTTLQAAAYLLSGAVTVPRWYVEGILDIPGGLDVRKTVQVNIT